MGTQNSLWCNPPSAFSVRTAHQGRWPTKTLRFQAPPALSRTRARIVPHHCIREALIEDQWDEILRFIATIRPKITTASQLSKRLNSCSRQHPLYRALKEFGKITKTLFILKYCDDLQLRQAIEKQLNKGEGRTSFPRPFLSATATSSSRVRRRIRRSPRPVVG